MIYLCRVIATLLLISTFSSCDEKKDEDYFKGKLEDMLSIQISDSFEVVKYEVFGSIGKQVEQFELKFDSAEFEQIIKSLKLDESNLSQDQSFYYMSYQISEYKNISIVFSKKGKTIKYSYSDY